MKSPLRRLIGSATLFLIATAPVAAGDGLTRLEATWAHLHDYSVTIEAHEVLGKESDEHELRYEFRKPDQARLDVLVGTKSGSTIVWNGGDHVIAYRKNFSLFKIHGSARQKDLTSLRGNSILSPNMGDLLSCFEEHRDAIHEHDGPVVNGEATDEISLSYANVVCPDDSAADRAVTADILDVSKKSGLILMRKRFEGDELVEQWELKDYKVDANVSDSDFR
jgi:outer membrane lipoprotein-sorting protein